MSNYIEVIAIVEGKTEQIFIEKILCRYLARKNIGMRATQISKPGQKGGDIRFSRMQHDLGVHLKQRPETYVTTFFDYYGIKEWPNLDRIPAHASAANIAQIINESGKSQIISLFSEQGAERRFVPFVAVHEFEALLFSDSRILAEQLNVTEDKIANVLSECGSPEEINNNPNTAPSKRLDIWAPNKKFLKITMGITIAKQIGVDKMREACPPFNQWLSVFEQLQRNS